MSSLAEVARLAHPSLIEKYGHLMRHEHHYALKQIMQCHTPDAGAMLFHCDSCGKSSTLYPGCGHRHCPACQHHANTHWLAVQTQKLLPVNYFLVTFTLPYQLRQFMWFHQQWGYHALFNCATATLRSFFSRDKHLGDKLGLTAVLHTHSRRLDYHPHIHFIVPAGALNKHGTLFQQKQGRYLFKADNLAKVFRGKFMDAMQQSGYHLPANTPTSWVADVEYVGQGDKALTYLARYLYRGVINEQNIIENQHGNVTFRYRDSTTKQDKYITEPSGDFLWRVIQHVLPKGFQRTRNCGFLHGNAKRTLQRIQLLLKMQLPPLINTVKAPVCCPHCNAHMTLYLARIGRHIIGQHHVVGLSI